MQADSRLDISLHKSCPRYEMLCVPGLSRDFRDSIDEDAAQDGHDVRRDTAAE